jgi:transcription-repair coupling factor (superfamily II helicase)
LKEEDWYKESVKQDADSNDSSKQVFSRQFVRDTQVDTDLQLLIPDFYVSNLTERLLLYRELDNFTKEEELTAFESNLRDRFGPLPTEVIELINVVRMRWKAMKLGFEKITLKNGIMLAYFLSKQDSDYYNSSEFKAVLLYVQKSPNQTSLKEKNNKLWLSIQNVKSVDFAIQMFDKINAFLEKNKEETN